MNEVNILTQKEMRPESGPRIDEPIPQCPHVHGMPESVKVDWRKTYAARFADNADDFRLDPRGRRRDALRQANRIFRTPQINSFAEALALPEWQVLANPDGTRNRFKRRDKKTGKLLLWLITIDAKKYSFEIPAGSEDSVPTEVAAAQAAAAATTK